MQQGTDDFEDWIIPTDPPVASVPDGHRVQPVQEEGEPLPLPVWDPTAPGAMDPEPRTYAHTLAPENMRVIECGTFTEYRFTLEGLAEGPETLNRSDPRTFEDFNITEKWNSVQRRTSYYREAAFAFERLMDCNLCPGDRFITLTFADPSWCPDRYREANLEFGKFIKRLRRHVDQPFEYAKVWEIQEGRRKKYGDTVIHYHFVAFGLGFVDARDLTALWGHGRIDIQALPEDFPARYLSKYFCKGFTDEDMLDMFEGRPRNSRAWTTSRGVKRPKDTRIRMPYSEALNLMAHRMKPRLRTYRDMAGHTVQAWRVFKDPTRTLPDAGSGSGQGCP